MYSIFADNLCIYSDVSPLENVKLIAPKLVIEDNAAGSLNMTVPITNIGYNSITRMDTDIIVKRDGREIWRGRVLTEREDFWNNRVLYCEGELAFLNDSTQPPAEYHDQTVRGFLTTLIGIHNAKVSENRQFTIGAVTVTDPNDSLYRYTNYEKTLECINEKLIKRLGGHIRVRHENGIRYIDYLADSPNTNTQVIEFGQNLTDFTRNFDMTEYATVIVPLGARLDESPIEALEAYLTVESVNQGSIYVQSDEAVREHGWIEKVVTWDDVTVPANLLSKALAYLSDTQFDNMVIELSALDMHYYNVNFEAVKILDKIRVKSRPHGLDRYFMVSKLEIPLDTPEETIFTLGDSVKPTLTSANNQVNTEILQKIENLPKKQEILEEAKANATAIMNLATNGYISIVHNESLDCSDALLVTDTPDYQDATKIWRLNMNGFGYSNDGGETWGLAITMDGAIVADYITAGTLSGDLIRAGTIRTEALSVAYRNSVADAINGAKLVVESEFAAADQQVISAISESYTSDISASEQRSATLIRQTKNEIEVSAATTYSTKAELANLEQLFLTYTDFEDSNGDKILDSDGEVIKARTNAEGISAVEVYSAINMSADTIRAEVHANYSTIADLTDLSDSVTNRLRNYSTTVEMYSAIEATAQQITLSVSENYATVRQLSSAEQRIGEDVDDKLEEYSTTVEMNSAISASARQIRLQVSQNFTSKTEFENTVEELNASITTTASSIRTEVNRKVNSSEFGTYMQQNYNSFILGFNGASRVMQISASGLTVYSGGEIAERNKIFSLSQYGMRFFDTGEHVGNIGSSHWTAYPSTRGLSFQLDTQGYYLAWSRKNSDSDPSYITILTYTRGSIGSDYSEGEGLYIGTKLYANSNARFKAIRVTGTAEFTTSLSVSGSLIASGGVFCPTNYGISWGGNMGLRYADSSHGGYSSKSGLYLGITANDCHTIIQSGGSGGNIYIAAGSFLNLEAGTRNSSGIIYVNSQMYYNNVPCLFNANYGAGWMTSSSSMAMGIRYCNSSSGLSEGFYVGIDGKTLYLRGSTFYAGGSTIATNSDARKKNDINSLEKRYLDFIKTVDPVSFKYNPDISGSGRTHTGFIAQDVLAAMTAAGIDTSEFAGFVDIDNDGKEYALRYEEFISPMLLYIKHLEKRIELLERGA